MQNHHLTTWFGVSRDTASFSPLLWRGSRIRPAFFGDLLGGGGIIENCRKAAISAPILGGREGLYGESRFSRKMLGMAEKPDSVLVEAAINGEADSFTELCKRYYPAMVAIAHSVIGDRHLAEDAAQQAFAKAACQLPQLRDRSRFAGWLAAICRNAAKDIARSSSACENYESFSAAADQSQDDQTSEYVREALGRLSASAREVIFLRFYDGLSYEQISAVLGMSEQAVNGRLRRAKRKLAHYLQRKGFGRTRL